jgi:tRNA(adenine34) deaminase
MQQALSLARRAAQVGEVPVGAIVVKDNIATARAYNTRQQSKNPTAHAEILVIQQASMVIGDWRLTDTTLYVTLEPCPMCVGRFWQVAFRGLSMVLLIRRQVQLIHSLDFCKTTG